MQSNLLVSRIGAGRWTLYVEKQLPIRRGRPSCTNWQRTAAFATLQKPYISISGSIVKFSRRNQSSFATACSSKPNNNRNLGRISKLRQQPLAFSAASSSLSLADEDDDNVDDFKGGRNEKEIDLPSNKKYTEQLLPHQKFSESYVHRSFDRDRQDATMKTKESSSLDLELGEDTIWDSSKLDDRPWYENEDGEVYVETGNKNSKYSRSIRSAREILKDFDCQNPPSNLSSFGRSDSEMEELQLWLECESQQESVVKYQSIIESARKRKDYTSLSSIQRQVVHWFAPVTAAIAKQQQEYLRLDMKDKEENSAEGKDIHKKQKKTVASFMRYGPYLCSLPAEKLAVICSHEALMCCLLKMNAPDINGVYLSRIALDIGTAIEEEVLIHRMLLKRKSEQQEEGKEKGKSQPNKQGTNESDEENDNISTTRSTPQHQNNKTWSYAASHLKSYLDELSQGDLSKKKRYLVKSAISRARKALQHDSEPWSSHIKIQLGCALIKILLDNANTLRQPNQYGNKGTEDRKAFRYEKRWARKGKLQGYVVLHDELIKLALSDTPESLAGFANRHRPMIVKPRPWTRLDKGGYTWLKVDLMKFNGCNTQKEALQLADLSTVYGGLDALGRVPWKINKRVLQAAQHCWQNNIPLGDIPSRTDYELPPKPIMPHFPKSIQKEGGKESNQLFFKEREAYRDANTKYLRVKQRNMDLNSLRCSAMLKLEQASKFQDFDSIYFPYNIDFRGRAYPIPPHLSNVGSDLCRGMLTFAQAKPLGERGLYWLQVHLANLAGKDKMSFDDRAAFVDENIEKVRASASNPLGDSEDHRWWMKNLEDPFQGLATCIEIVKALDSGHPPSYKCALPVHMDGSCNGLQHYAALGRDAVGGKAVNLCIASDDDQPEDVYVGVMEEVIRRVAAEANRNIHADLLTADPAKLSKKERKELNSHRAAKLVNGLIDRGVVKRTVMTSVYGVTYVGARQQIQEKLEEKLENQGNDIDEMNHEIFQASGYLARLTMDVIGDLFSGARETMNWLTACARMMSQKGYPIAWMSPIGLPAVQPYRQKKIAQVVTALQVVSILNRHDDLPIHKARQVSAFPPNYVHSLDSSHMLLTALEMDKRGLFFSAVHDSFWTHACDVEEMNEVLRDVFVELYDQPLLERLKSGWEMRYPDLKFPDIPENGALDLKEVKLAKYFFQ